VQTLLRRVTVRPDERYSQRFPAEMPCRVRLTLRDGRILTRELADYPGFLTRGRTWEAAREKLERLGAQYTTPSQRDQIAVAVASLEGTPVTALTRLLADVRPRAPAVAG
jgi:2-methylcitrate dehydratase